MKKQTNQFLLREGKSISLIAYTYTAFAKDILYVIVGILVFRVDPGTGRWEKIGTIPVQYQKRLKFDRCMKIYDDKLMLWNFDIGSEYLFDIKKGIGEEIVFGTGYKGRSGKSGCYTIAENEDCFFFIPSKADELWVYWKALRKYEVQTKWKKTLVEELSNKGLNFKFIRFQSVQVCEKHLYVNVSTDHCDLFAVFDIDGFQLVGILEPGCTGENFGILIQGKSLYFHNRTDKNSQLVRWSEDKSKVESVWKIEDKKRRRGDMVKANDKILLIIRNGDIYVMESGQKDLRKETVVQGILSSCDCVAGKMKLVLLNDDGIALWDVQSNVCQQLSIPWLDFFIAFMEAGGIYGL